MENQIYQRFESENDQWIPEDGDLTRVTSRQLLKVVNSFHVGFWRTLYSVIYYNYKKSMNIFLIIRHGVLGFWGFGVGVWLLVVGCWWLVVDGWFLVVVCCC